MGNFKKKLRDFVKGKPHSERRLGDLYICLLYTSHGRHLGFDKASA